MTRLIPLLSMILLAGPGQARPTTDLAEALALPALVTEAAPLEADLYVSADIGFADAMRMLTTVTIPEPGDTGAPATVLRVRTVHSIAWVTDQQTERRTVRPVH